MLFPLRSYFQKPSYLTATKKEVIFAKAAFARYIKPAMVALLTSAIIAFLTGILFIAISNNVFKEGKKGTEMQQSYNDENRIAFFLNKVQQHYPITFQKVHMATVQLSTTILYRLNQQTTYQEIIILNEKYIPFIQ